MKTDDGRVIFQKDRDFGELFAGMFSFIRQEFKTLFKPILYWCGPLFLIGGIVMSFLMGDFLAIAADIDTFAGPVFVDTMVNYAVVVLIYSGVSVLLSIIVHSYVKIYAETGESPSLDELKPVMKELALPFIGYGFVLVIILAIGFFALIFPGIYLGVSLSIIFMVRTMEGPGFSYSFKRSFNLISGNWWFVFGALIVLSLLIYFLSSAMQMPANIAMWIAMLLNIDKSATYAFDPNGWVSVIFMIAMNISMLVQIFLSVLSIVFVAFIYFRLVEQKESPGLIARVEKLGEPANASSD